MSKKSSGNASKKGSVRKPSPSGMNKKNDTGAEVRKKNHKQSIKKRRKNELSLNTSDSMTEKYPGQNYFDQSAEDVLKKRRHKDEEGQYIKPLKPLPPAKEPSSPYKRKLKRVLFYAATIAVLVFVCCVLSLTVFFKIDSIEVEGETRYDVKDIIGSSCIKQGDNLILCNTSPGEKEIWDKFPYIENVSINKKLFNKIVIEVKEAVPTSIIESDGKYILLSESGKIIDISDKRQSNAPIVLGAKLETPALSKTVKYKDPNVEGYINQMLECAEKYEIGTIETIDITVLSKITLERKQGLKIIIGSPENIDYKLKTARKIIEKSVPENDQGTLDVSHASTEGGKSYFSSKKPEVSKVESSAETSKSKSEQKNDQGSQVDKASSAPLTQSSGESSQVSGQQSSGEETSSENTETSVQTGNEDSNEDTTSYDVYTDEGYTDDGYVYSDDYNYDDGYTYDYNADNGYDYTDNYDNNNYTYDNSDNYTYE